MLRPFSLHGLTRLRGGSDQDDGSSFSSDDDSSNLKASHRGARQNPSARKAGDKAKRGRRDAESSVAADEKHATKKPRPGKEGASTGGKEESEGGDSRISRNRAHSADSHAFVSLGDSLPTDAIDQAYDMFSQESQVSLPPLR